MIGFNEIKDFRVSRGQNAGQAVQQPHYRNMLSQFATGQFSYDEGVNSHLLLSQAGEEL